MDSLSSVQSLSRVSITNSRNTLKLMSIESVMPSNHLILCRPLVLLPSILPNIRVFPNESALHIRWPKYWNFGFSNSPSNEYSGLISLQSKELSPHIILNFFDHAAVCGILVPRLGIKPGPSALRA